MQSQIVVNHETESHNDIINASDIPTLSEHPSRAPESLPNPPTEQPAVLQQLLVISQSHIGRQSGNKSLRSIPSKVPINPSGAASGNLSDASTPSVSNNGTHGPDSSDASSPLVQNLPSPPQIPVHTQSDPIQRDAVAHTPQLDTPLRNPVPSSRLSESPNIQLTETITLPEPSTALPCLTNSASNHLLRLPTIPLPLQPQRMPSTPSNNKNGPSGPLRYTPLPLAATTSSYLPRPQQLPHELNRPTTFSNLFSQQLPVGLGSVTPIPPTNITPTRPEAFLSSGWGSSPSLLPPLKSTPSGNNPVTQSPFPPRQLPSVSGHQSSGETTVFAPRQPVSSAVDPRTGLLPLVPSQNLPIPSLTTSLLKSLQSATDLLEIPTTSSGTSALFASNSSLSSFTESSGNNTSASGTVSHLPLPTAQHDNDHLHNSNNSAVSNSQRNLPPLPRSDRHHHMLSMTSQLAPGTDMMSFTNKPIEQQSTRMLAISDFRNTPPPHPLTTPLGSFKLAGEHEVKRQRTDRIASVRQDWSMFEDGDAYVELPRTEPLPRTPATDPNGRVFASHQEQFEYNNRDNQHLLGGGAGEDADETQYIYDASGNPIELNVRRRSKLPLAAILGLRAWFKDSLSMPYPSAQEKFDMASRLNLDFRQVHNWFSNTRKRLYAPFLKKHGIILLPFKPLSDEDTEYVMQLITECTEDDYMGPL